MLKLEQTDFITRNYCFSPVWGYYLNHEWVDSISFLLVSVRLCIYIFVHSYTEPWEKKHLNHISEKCRWMRDLQIYLWSLNSCCELLSSNFKPFCFPLFLYLSIYRFNHHHRAVCPYFLRWSASVRLTAYCGWLLNNWAIWEAAEGQTLLGVNITASLG